MRTLGLLVVVMMLAGTAGAQTTRPADESARTPHTPLRDGEVRQLLIRELGNFPYDPEAGGGIPEDVKRLSGSKVRLVGYMMPTDMADKVVTFALVPSLVECCFGQPPQVHHTITVNCPPGKTVAYYPEEIVCEGILKVEEKREDNYTISVFELDVTSIRPHVQP